MLTTTGGAQAAEHRRRLGNDGRAYRCRRRAWVSWGKESASVACSFAVVSVLVIAVDTALVASPVLLLLGALIEIVVLWRWVWATLAVLALLLPTGSRRQRLLGGAITVWGTGSAKRMLGGAVVSTVLAGGLFSGTAAADPVPEVSDTLWPSVASPDLEPDTGPEAPLAPGGDPGDSTAVLPAPVSHPLDLALHQANSPGREEAASLNRGAAATPSLRSSDSTPDAKAASTHPPTLASQAPRPSPEPAAAQAGRPPASVGTPEAPATTWSPPSNGRAGGSPGLSAVESPPDDVWTDALTRSSFVGTVDSETDLRSTPNRGGEVALMQALRKGRSDAGPESATKEATTLTHTVAAGECLWTIAASILPRGSAEAEIDALWRQIYADNYVLIGDDPDFIEPGMVLVLMPAPASPEVDDVDD